MKYFNLPPNPRELAILAEVSRSLIPYRCGANDGKIMYSLARRGYVDRIGPKTKTGKPSYTITKKGISAIRDNSGELI